MHYCLNSLAFISKYAVRRRRKEEVEEEEEEEDISQSTLSYHPVAPTAEVQSVVTLKYLGTYFGY